PRASGSILRRGRMPTSRSGCGHAVSAKASSAPSSTTSRSRACPSPGSRPRGLALVHGRDDVRAVRGERPVLVVVLEVEGELVHAEAGELMEPLDLRRGRADEAEAVDDLVGDELGVRVARAPVLVVVVAVPSGDVVR